MTRDIWAGMLSFIALVRFVDSSEMNKYVQNTMPVYNQLLVVVPPWYLISQLGYVYANSIEIP